MSKKIKNPKSFSEVFGVSGDLLASEGILDPVLNVDTKLFIDPLLLTASRHPEIRRGAVAAYDERFSTLIKLLAGSKSEGDVAWRTSARLMEFPEIKGTCIGYGAASISGRSWGPQIGKRVLVSAKEIVDLGIKDPDLFMVVALLEDGVGPDLISDMTTNVILPALSELNARICKSLGVPTQPFTMHDGKTFQFAKNPFVGNEPVILLPLDILRDLPIVTDWSEVGDAAAKNSALRGRVNKLIGRIWEASVRKKRKDAIRAQIYSSKEAFEAILETIRTVPKVPYDSEADPEGHLAWIHVHRTVAKDFPLTLSLIASPTIDDVDKVVARIVEHFRELIEDKGLWKELWSGKKPRPEKAAQRLFFAVADAYCRANNLDITPEADSGSGPVDFKVSSSYENRVLVEIKLSTNSAAVHGYETQLATYKKAENTTRATFLMIDVGSLGSKAKRILAIKNAAVAKGEPVSEFVLLDGKRKQSASKR